MWNIDISHAPHLYGYGATGLVILSALVIFVIELRRVGGSPWPEWHNSKMVPLYHAPRSRSRVPVSMLVPPPGRDGRRPRRSSAPRRAA